MLTNDFIELCNDLLHRKETQVHLAHFFSELDRIFGIEQVYKGPRFAPHREIVEVSLEIVKQVRRLNASKNSNEAIRKHFDYIFNIQEHQLDKQLIGDYRSMKLVPAYGNPLGFISNEIDADELLLPKDHKPNDEVLSYCIHTYGRLSFGYRLR